MLWFTIDGWILVNLIYSQPRAWPIDTIIINDMFKKQNISKRSGKRKMMWEYEKGGELVWSIFETKKNITVGANFFRSSWASNYSANVNQLEYRLKEKTTGLGIHSYYFLRHCINRYWTRTNLYILEWRAQLPIHLCRCLNYRATERKNLSSRNIAREL